MHKEAYPGFTALCSLAVMSLQLALSLRIDHILCWILLALHFSDISFVQPGHVLMEERTVRFGLNLG